jgi:hypothetical protein
LTGSQKTCSRKVLEWTEEHTESFNNIRKEREKIFFLDNLEMEINYKLKGMRQIVQSHLLFYK